MRWFVRTRWVGVVGACGLVVVAVMLLLGELSLAEAARRAAVLLAVVLVLEHLVLPFARFLVGEPSAAEQDDDSAGPLRAGPTG